MLDTLRAVMRFRRFETDPVTRRLRGAASIEDLRRIARRRLPRGVFDYIDGGAEDERALAANTAAFGELTFVPRVLRHVGRVDTATTLLGRPLPFPLVLAPTGFTRIAHPDGELAVARAAAAAGIPYGLSTMGTRSIEDVAAAAPTGRNWFQVYVWKDRGLVQELLERAAAADYEALVLTVDTAVLGRRERDVRRGMIMPPQLGPGTIVDGILHPAWTWQFVRHDPIVFANVAGRTVGDGARDAVSLVAYSGAQFTADLSWDDVEWFRSHWQGPMVIKGIQSVEDARIAVDDFGIEVVALSNHGGRQLDSAPTPISLVAPVADAVGGRTEIICDGGVRRGSDIVKAVALGATCCMAGRPYLYGLAAGGERGVEHVLRFLHDGMRQTMALIGAASVSELDPSVLAG